MGTLLTMATVAPASRGTISPTAVFSYSTYSEAQTGLRTFAFSEARSRNTTRRVMRRGPLGPETRRAGSRGDARLIQKHDAQGHAAMPAWSRNTTRRVTRRCPLGPE